jgi:high-affinity iron transporter
VLPGLNSLAFDVSAVIPPDSWYGTLLKGTINFSPATTWLQAIVWCAYVIPVMTIFVRALRGHGTKPGAAAEATDTATTAASEGQLTAEGNR